MITDDEIRVYFFPKFPTEAMKAVTGCTVMDRDKQNKPSRLR